MKKTKAIIMVSQEDIQQEHTMREHVRHNLEAKITDLKSEVKESEK